MGSLSLSLAPPPFATIITPTTLEGARVRAHDVIATEGLNVVAKAVHVSEVARLITTLALRCSCMRTQRLLPVCRSVGQGGGRHGLPDRSRLLEFCQEPVSTDRLGIAGV